MRPRRRVCAIFAVLAVSIVLASCSADRQHRRDEPEVARAAEPPRNESRTGVPILMDIPILGILFSRRTVSR